MLIKIILFMWRSYKLSFALVCYSYYNYYYYIDWWKSVHDQKAILQGIAQYNAW